MYSHNTFIQEKATSKAKFWQFRQGNHDHPNFGCEGIQTEMIYMLKCRFHQRSPYFISDILY